MKKTSLKSFSITIIIIWLTAVISNIKAQDTLWTRRFDQGRNEEAWGMTKDSSDNIIIVGPSQRDSFTSDILVLKYNQNGNLLWSRVFDTGQIDWGFCVTSDSAGNIIVGSYHDDLTIEKPGLTKFSPAGEILWSRMYPELARFLLLGVTLDSQSNIYACGMGATSSIAVIMKCDPSGNILWRRFYNWQNEPGFTSIVIDETENLFVTGFFGVSVLLIGKFNNNGDSLWTRQYQGIGYSAGSDIKLDQQRNIIIAGSLGMGNNSDALIVKYSPTGSMLWNRVFNYHPFDGFSSLYLDIHNDIFCCGGSGLWLGWVNFLCDHLLVKLSTSGETLWTRFYDGGYDDYAVGVVTDNQNNPIITGYSSNGPNYDVLTIKYRGTTGIEEFAKKFNLPNPNYKVRFANIRTRDGKINLEINKPDNYKISLYNSIGTLVQIIHQGYLSQGLHQYNLNRLQNGVYFLNIDNGKNKTSHKIVYTAR